MLGRWDHWWAGNAQPVALGSSVAYEKGAEWLVDCSPVEDWGCGPGYFRTCLAPDQEYVGVDGSATPHAHVTVDLTEYRSSVPGVFCRGVLEHNYDWHLILDNLLASFTKRACLVLFTPMVDLTHEIGYDRDPGVPIISFAPTDLLDLIGAAGVRGRIEKVDSPETAYGTETIFFLEK